MTTKARKIERFNHEAPRRAYWRRRNRYYYDDLEGHVSRIVPVGSDVLELGCGTGEMLVRLNPRRGLGVDIAERMIGIAREQFADAKGIEFRTGDAELLDVDETFDYIILSDVIGELEDVWGALRCLRQVTDRRSRVVITYFNHLWEPILRIGERLGLKMPQDHQNWLSPRDIENLLALNGFEVVTTEYRLLLPKYVPLLSTLFNRWVAKLPLIRRLCLSVHLVARRLPEPSIPSPEPSVTVLIPCRNERGNVRPAVERTPEMGTHTEILFVDGNSNDGTVEAIESVIAKFRDRDIKLLHQVPPGSDDGLGHGKMLKLGKGDAVRKGFLKASGDILMILDADLTVPPEDLPKFYLALVEGRGEFVNGNRLVYPMERQAMRFLNKIANKAFGMIFSWLLNQHVKDTLCGTKVLYRADYLRMLEQTNTQGDDPFGDFDLLFGASEMSLQIREVPIRYRERSYGEIKIRRFRHGIMLLKMVFVAMRRVKFR